MAPFPPCIWHPRHHQLFPSSAHPFFVFWFWGGELLRTASAHTKLQAAARQGPCRWPLFTKLMEAESLQLQMVVPRGKCVNSGFNASQFMVNHDTSPSILTVSLSWLLWKRLGNGILKHSIEFQRTVQWMIVQKFTCLIIDHLPIYLYLPYKKTV